MGLALLVEKPLAIATTTMCREAVEADSSMAIVR
jgi:hypothetical protein